MNDALQAIKDCMDDLNFSEARDLATAYVQEHPDEFTDFAEMPLDKVVEAVEVFRLAGMLEAQYRAEVWHLRKWAPQDIGGTYQPQIRIADPVVDATQ